MAALVLCQIFGLIRWHQCTWKYTALFDYCQGPMMTFPKILADPVRWGSILSVRRIERVHFVSKEKPVQLSPRQATHGYTQSKLAPAKLMFLTRIGDINHERLEACSMKYNFFCPTMAKTVLQQQPKRWIHSHNMNRKYERPGTGNGWWSYSHAVPIKHHIQGSHGKPRSSHNLKKVWRRCQGRD